MKYFTFIRSICLLCLMSLTLSEASSQVLNGNFNYQLEFRKPYNVPLGAIGHTLNFYATNDLDNVANLVTPNPFPCAVADADTAFENELPIFSTQTQSPNNKTDLAVRGFMKNSDLPDYCTFGSGDVPTFLQAFLLDDPRITPKNSNNFNDFVLTTPLNTGGDGLLRFRNYWRYGAGTRLKNTALDFGQIPLFGTREHINNNYPAPYNNTTTFGNYGYNNRYSPVGGFTYTQNMQNSADVSYTFTIPANAYVTITTDDPLTDFDTYIHLVTLSTSGFLDFNADVISDDNSGANGTSTISRFLCNPSATYGIIVEGKDGAARPNGTFKLKIKVEFISPGSIEAGHDIPNPQELFPDFASNVSAPSPNISTLISWEKSTDNGSNWTLIPSANGIAYQLPVATTETQYRRKVEGCFGGTLNSNTAIIKIVNPNGVISGKVTSLNGITGIKGIEIIAYKNGVSLSGSPASFVYRDTTDDQGEYSIQPIYYGRTDATTNTPFVVKPIKPGHRFNNDSLIKTLTNLSPQQINVNFIDSTGYAITGKTYQECADCNNSSTGNQEFQTCPLDSVRIASNVAGVLPVISGFNGTDYGRYGLIVQNPGSNNITASYRNHLFTPPIRNVNIVNSDFENIDFNDTSTHVITGFLTAGCGDYIGTAVLEFSDILPNDAQNNPRSSCFTKRVTTNAGSGFYSIRLPARKYKVKVIGFSPTSEVTSPELLAFFNTLVPKDSLVRDITERDTTLNFVYQRPPVMVLEGLNNDCNRTPADSAFAVFPQSVTKNMLIKVYQGPAAKACPVPDSSIVLINTNIQNDDNNESLSHRTKNGIDSLQLTGGTPNIVPPYYKTLNIQFSDRFGRQATPINRNVVVTGLKSNIGTFTTVSPQIPLMVLHDPPGDNSFSFWETSQTNETAMRFYAADDKSASLWAEVKVGTEVTTGLAVSTQTSVWGTINGSVGVAARNTTSSETILTTTTTSNFSTSNNPSVNGSSGDVFIGTALNLKYAIATELTYTPPCQVSSRQKLMIANTGFGTQYIYSESYITNTHIPGLRLIRDLSTDSAERRKYDTQISIWEQVLANNEENKRRAIFDKNYSFDGNAGAYSSTTTTTSTKSSTIEFALELEAAVAASLGFEAAGSGVSGGVNVAFKVETGNSKTNTSISQTTMGYTLDDDDDNGDYFSVNVKKDPVYNTPVFEMVAGTSSCPVEPGTQPRDEMQLVAPVPVVSGVAPDGEAEFILLLSNTSQSLEERTYQLSFNQASNPNGAVITIGGSPVLVPISYTIGYLGQVQVIVKVKRGAANIFSYEGLQFQLTDNCGGQIVKSVSISAFFTSTCSNIVLSEPANNWTSTTFNNSILPVLFKGYNLANLTSVTLEYSRAGLSNWTDGFTRTAAQINNSINGTLVNWNIAGIEDGTYNLRLRLNCASGVVYSERVTGTIDRKGPLLFGTQQPSDDNYVTGDVISARFNENLDCASITNFNAQMKRLSNNQVIDARLGCYQNEIVIVPVNAIAGFVGDTMEVVLQNIPDIYGNVKATGDAWRFTVGTTVPDASSKAVKLVVGSTGAGAGGRPGILESNTASILENSGDSIVYKFKLPVNAPNDIRVNYIVSGNSSLNNDYIVGYSQAPTQTTSYDGSRGTIIIKQGTKTATLKIKPVANTQASNNKTITLSLAEGGDYLLGDSTAATGTIINDDLPATYTFTGNGNFTEPSNWLNGLVPPYTTLIYDEIIINPAGNGECILNVPLRIREGGKLTIIAGKKFTVNGNVRVANY
ncbi:MAG: hypothetical protein IPP72_14900 [Chitinophagaceae bacterium]|nr:hypothetical protein [Chitinophagaceae bacterium]